ncbi:MAG: prolipoprotein diacylglyceryl transferase [Myxococcales bacterium]|nr:prolipoprotein diacylglyceryl transferase [Myxococcales bacterium]
MRPILYDFHIDLPLLGPLNFPSYFTMLTLSFLLGLWMTAREAPRLGLDKDRITDMNLWIVVWAIVGARALHVLADGHLMDYVNLCLDPTQVKALDAKVALCHTSAECGYDYVCHQATRTCHPPQDCLAALKVWRGGLAFYGGFLFAATFGLWYAHKHRMGMGKVADLTSPWIAFGLALTRTGCFLNGCCFGKVTDGRFGVHFPFGSAVFDHQRGLGLIGPYENPLPVHPTQLYQAALNLLTFFALYFVVRRRKRFDGEVFAWLLILKGVFRSLVEIWRDDDRGVFAGGTVSTSQLISLPLIAVGIYLLVKKPGAKASASALT